MKDRPHFHALHNYSMAEHGTIGNASPRVVMKSYPLTTDALPPGHNLSIVKASPVIYI
jgi:hypothetical protein